MADYACFTDKAGKQTWWERQPNGTHVFVADENDVTRGSAHATIMDAHTAKKCDLVRTDHDDLPGEVWARIVAKKLLEGE